MKNWFFMAAAFFSTAVAAQNPLLTYRMQDPFVFCTQGQDKRMNPSPCWWPIPPYTGAFMMNPSCDPPNPYGRFWSADDTASWGQYLTVCPQGIKPGSWGGKGVAEMTPYYH